MRAVCGPRRCRVLVKRSSGSSTRLPTMVVWLSAAICLLLKVAVAGRRVPHQLLAAVACLRAALAHTLATCSVRVSWTGRTPPPRWPRIGAGRTICQRRWSGRCGRPSPARHWRRGRRGDLRAWPPVRDGRRLTHPPAHRVSGHFRSGSVIAPMPAGRDPADHELGREAGRAWARPGRAAHHEGSRIHVH